MYKNRKKNHIYIRTARIIKTTAEKGRIKKKNANITLTTGTKSQKIKQEKEQARRQ
jgi:hypothetical protein